MRKGQWDSLQINTHLINKYGSNFSFFFNKPTNEIVYNHTCALSTISFKDSVIYADNNQYLKRYYFLKNALNNDQIFDRINLLAQFYSTTVILKYQHPMMLLTNTKSIFLKRLKRMKKMLVQQGSSDQSKSSNSSKPISFNDCSSFLKSLSFGELQQKSLDDSNHIKLDFSLFQDNQDQIHDTYAQNEEDQNIKQQIFLLNINRLAKDINLEFILEKQESENTLKHLISDFDDIDTEDVMKKYQKIIEKQNVNNQNKPASVRKTSNIMKSSQMKNPVLINDLIGKKPMTSSITITALDDRPNDGMHYHASPTTRNIQKTSMMSPLRVGGMSHQKMDGDKKNMKKSSFYQYELQHKRFMSHHNEAINEDQFEDSPKNNKNSKFNFKKFDSLNIEDRNFMPVNRQEEINSKTKIRQMQPLSSRQFKLDQKSPQYRNYAYPNNQKMKYSSIIGNEQPFSRKQKLFNRDKRQDIYKSVINDVQEEEYEYVKHQNYKTRYDNLNHKHFNTLNSPSNRMTSINININNLQEKKQRVNLRVNKNNIPLNEEYNEEQKNFRAQKKKKIREKAAALLNRVKSHEYLSSGTPSNQYSQYQSSDQFGNNYYERFYK